LFLAFGARARKIDSEIIRHPQKLLLESDWMAYQRSQTFVNGAFTYASLAANASLNSSNIAFRAPASCSREAWRRSGRGARTRVHRRHFQAVPTHYDAGMPLPIFTTKARPLGG
jgi:hypothetical protein